jgi:hypothetical protein
LVANIFIFIVQSFFDFQWLTKDIDEWTPLLIIRYTLPWVVLCLASYLLFPSFEGNEIIDFKDNFNKFSTGGFKFCVVLIPFVMFYNITYLSRAFFDVENLFMLIGLTFALVAIFIKKDWVRVFAVSLGTCYLIYHALFHGQI